MKIKFGNLLIASGLLFFDFGAWLWMSGKLAVPPELLNDMPAMVIKWANPGYLSFPIMVGIFALIVAVILILIAFPDQDPNREKEGITKAATE